MGGRPVVVGVDGSVASQHAVLWAAELARVIGAEVVAVHAVGLLEAAHAAPAGDHPATDRVRSWCTPLAGGPVPFRVVVCDGGAVDVLLAASEREGARLVVVGNRGTGGREPLALGSTSLHLLQTARIPVLVVPDRGGEARPVSLAHQRVLVGVDRSAHSLAALAVAAELADLGAGSLTVLEVSEFVPPFPITSSAAPPSRGGWASLEEVLSEIRERGVHVQPVERSGQPVSTILEVADELDVGMLVVGTRGRGGPDELTLGSVARSVADRARQPVLVVPAEAGPVHLRAGA